jgi:Domain of unknown function (DUF4861)
MKTLPPLLVLSVSLSGLLGSEPAAAEPAAAPIAPIGVTLVNPLAAPRTSETIVLTRAQLGKVAPLFDLTAALVVDARERPVLSQLVDTDGDESPDEIVFQTDLGPRETRTFELRVGPRRPAARSEFKVYGRFVRERHDDFAWENDRVAHRMYGPGLETWKKDPQVSSGVDVWVKRVRSLVVNDWYLTDDYHQDRGEGADFYAVGKSRGCGGLGIWAGGKLHVSRNFTGSRVLANGPIRLEFELDYAPWDTGGGPVAETKRVILDAGASFNRFESTFSTGAKSVISVGLGIAKHPGHATKIDLRSGRMSVWEPLDGGRSGNLGCAIVLPPGSAAEAQQTENEYLLVTPAPVGGPIVYYVGTAWDRGGGVSDLGAWAREAQSLSDRLAAPVGVSLSVRPAAPPPKRIAP